jgi:hypothetical protein
MTNADFPLANPEDTWSYNIVHNFVEKINLIKKNSMIAEYRYKQQTEFVCVATKYDSHGYICDGNLDDVPEIIKTNCIHLEESIDIATFRISNDILLQGHSSNAKRYPNNAKHLYCHTNSHAKKYNITCPYPNNKLFEDRIKNGEKYTKVGVFRHDHKINYKKGDPNHLLEYLCYKILEKIKNDEYVDNIPKIIITECNY